MVYFPHDTLTGAMKSTYIALCFVPGGFVGSATFEKRTKAACSSEQSRALVVWRRFLSFILNGSNRHIGSSGYVGFRSFLGICVPFVSPMHTRTVGLLTEPLLILVARSDEERRDERQILDFKVKLNASLRVALARAVVRWYLRALGS